ncbi:MAG: CCA tRNA nucleotidyltransferase [Lachnospiraceae bacterium]
MIEMRGDFVYIPEKVEFILNKLNEAGYEAYAVGGCVRDLLLGREPGDWDITTSALPWQVKKIFPRTVDTGLQHGTVTVMLDHEGFEVTTYRVDGEYEDGRHPKEVSFTASLEEDLKRRDFTINAMAYHPKEGIIDIFHGQEDIKNKIVRCVGKAEDRFNEDALRILRAIRFSAQLGFEIEKGTRQAIQQLAENLSHVSKERIQVELVKMLTSSHPEKIRDAWELGVTRIFLPEFDAMMLQEQPCKFHYTNVGDHTIEVLKHVSPTKILRLAALLHDVGKPDVFELTVRGNAHFYYHEEVGEKKAKAILKRLKFDNDTIHTVCMLVRYHDNLLSVDERTVRRLLHQTGAEHFPDLLELMQADVMGKRPEYRTELLQQLDLVKSIFQKIIEEKQCFSMKDLAVKGSDLIAEGMKPGKELGTVLQSMLEHVLDCPQDNEKMILLQWWRES